MPRPGRWCACGGSAVNEDEDGLLSRAFELRCGKPSQKEQCVRLLQQCLGRKLQRYFERNRVPEAIAEEMVWDVWLKVLQGDFRGDTRPVVWIWTIARNHLISHHRKDHPEVDMDEESWEALVVSLPAAGIPAWARLCIERALAQFEIDHPDRTQVLRMIAEEWSAREIGEVFACNEGAARDRAYRTRELVRSYLEECREPA